jgi:hypothetical protein
MSITIPERSHQQRMDALELANRIRIGCADLKREIRAGRLTVRGVLLAPPEYAAHMKILDLLLAAPGVGPVKAMRTLRHAGISPVKTVGGLTERQCLELIGG